MHLEALLAHHVDFPEEDEPPVPLKRVIAAATDMVEGLDVLLATAPEGELLREGALVVFAGRPNAGKSSLYNALIGEERAIVTEEPGTTRDAVDVIFERDGKRFVAIDTAGLRKKSSLSDAIEFYSDARSHKGVRRADVVVLLIEAHRGVTEGVEAILAELPEVAKGRKVALAINKIDRVEAPVLLALTKDMNDRYDFAETFMISAEKGHGVEDLKTWLAGELPEGPWLYPEDQIADLPLRMIAAEMTREKLTLRLHQELPYQLTVETENWEERKDGSARIDQVIYVARDGHKGIILGKKGETIKAISKAAREELEEFLGRRVHLFLQIKVRENWLDEAERYSEMGLDFRDGNA